MEYEGKTENTVKEAASHHGPLSLIADPPHLPLIVVLYCLVFAAASGLAADLPDAADPAERAAAQVRAGVPKVEQQLAKELLMGLGPERAMAQVEALAASGDPLQREAALEILSAWPGPAARFTPFLKDRSYTVRRAALEAIGNGEEGGAVWQEIVPLVHDPFWPVRRSAVRALAAWPKPGTAELLLKALEDPEPEVRHPTLRLLSELEEELSAEALGKAWANLSREESLVFLDACLPLVRDSNLAFFTHLAKTEENSAASILSLRNCVALTRSVPDAWVPRLITASRDTRKQVAQAACVLLTVAGQAVVPPLRAGLEQGELEPHSLVHLLNSVLEDEAVPLLTAWILDQSLPAPARRACLDGLVHRRSPEAMATLVRIFPDLDGALALQAVERAFSLVEGPHALTITPLLEAALARPDPATAATAFRTLCVMKHPPLPLLIQAFQDQKDRESRDRYVKNLVNIHGGEEGNRVAELLLEEVEEQGPSALTAAIHLPTVAEGEWGARAVEPLRALLHGRADPFEQELLLVALMRLDLPDADRIVAEEMAGILDGSCDLNAAYLVTHLDQTHGPFTERLLHDLLPRAEEELARRIMRTLVRRGDPHARQGVEQAFVHGGISYRRSILEEIKAAGLSATFTDLLQAILLQEQDPDLLATAIDAASPELLQAQSHRLLELARLGPELGLDTVDAIYRALARTGSKEGRDYLRLIVGAFIDSAAAGPFLWEEEYAADLAMMAALSLAGVGDGEAPAMLARLLFIRALAYRELDILEEWYVKAEGGRKGKEHQVERQALFALLLYDDALAEKAVLDEIAVREKDGSLFRMGDALFCTLYRKLLHEPGAAGRCPAMADTFRELTLRAAPNQSPSDFRVHRIEADRAAAAKDYAAAAKACRAAHHIMKFHDLVKETVRYELGDEDPYRGFFHVDSMAADMHFYRALALEAAGESEAAQAERLKAWRRAPFRR